MAGAVVVALAKSCVDQAEIARGVENIAKGGEGFGGEGFGFDGVHVSTCLSGG